MNATAPNIESFNRGVLLILAALYEAFPNPITLDFGALAPDATHEEHVTHGNTLEFLQREGFVSYRGFADTGTLYFGVVLTAKALTLLNSTPKSLRARVPVGSMLVRLAKVVGVPVASAELPALLRLIGLN